MIQKKLCMVGAPGTGKTSLVQRFVHSKFSEKYHSTVGVKIDRKQVEVAGVTVNLLLWDLEGHDRFQNVQGSYLRGSSGLIFVADGTRRDTLETLAELRELSRGTIGRVPSVAAVNKADLTDAWQLGDADLELLEREHGFVLRTSAKTGDGVEDAFRWLAAATISG